jgi:hypothetical protein
MEGTDWLANATAATAVKKAQTPTTATAAIKELRGEQDYERQDGGRIIYAIFVLKPGKGYVKLQASESWNQTIVITSNNDYSTTDEGIESILYRYIKEGYTLVETVHQLSDGSTVRTTGRKKPI